MSRCHVKNNNNNNTLKANLNFVSFMVRLHKPAALRTSSSLALSTTFVVVPQPTSQTLPSHSHTLGLASSKLLLLRETSHGSQMSLMTPSKVNLFQTVSSLPTPIRGVAIYGRYSLICFLKLHPGFWNCPLSDRLDVVHEEQKHSSHRVSPSELLGTLLISNNIGDQ